MCSSSSSPGNQTLGASRNVRAPVAVQCQSPHAGRIRTIVICRADDRGIQNGRSGGVQLQNANLIDVVNAGHDEITLCINLYPDRLERGPLADTTTGSMVSGAVVSYVPVSIEITLPSETRNSAATDILRDTSW